MMPVMFKPALPLLQELLDFEFDFRYMMRGLIIDKKRGNILKMDRHKYVKVAFHGFRKLSREERLNTYAHARVRLHLNCHLSKISYLPTLYQISMLDIFMQAILLST